MANKMGARRVELDGFKFDSAAEAQRYQELKILEVAGRISRLEVHKPPFELAPRLVFESGQRTKPALRYTPDFTYFDNDLLMPVVEDVKGMETPGWRMRMHLFLLKYGHEYILRVTHVRSAYRKGSWLEIEDYQVG